MVDKNADLPIGTIMIEKAQFAWETAEMRKACEEFSTILEARFGKAPEKDISKKEPTSEKTPLIENKVKEGSNNIINVIEKKEERDLVTLKDIELKVKFSDFNP